MNMVIVDTSVWIDHFRTGLPELAALLQEKKVVTHSVVIGEMAVGNLPDRERTISGFRRFRRAIELRPDAVYDFVERHALFGLGLSWGDVQILASAVACGIPLWTTDKRLAGAASTMGILWTP